MAKARLLRCDSDYESLVDISYPINSFAPIAKMLGCELIEIVALPLGFAMLVDEEGIFKKNPKYNKLASAYARQRILGDALIVPDKEIL
jgi:hypothetical protein